MAWCDAFPTLDPDTLRALKLAIDEGFRAFTRSHGEAVEGWFEPLQRLLIATEGALLATPWPLVIAATALLAWAASRSWRISAGAVLTLLAVGALGMWDDTLKTVAMIAVSTGLAVAIGVPIGVGMARSRRLQSVLTPLLDVMQTLPSFVYLIPVVMLLGIGRVPGLLAVVVYALPPMIRLTSLGLREVDQDLLEVADAFGASPRQRLLGVQLPLALPTIMAGVNQTIMMALAMVVIASMIGVQGLGQPVLKAISNQYFALGLFNGLAIVAIAIVFDRVSQAWGWRLQRHRRQADG
ncbi:MAG: proline/glycine betaine ABC transporter permease [Aquabacterium sp.]|nr:proline/glycine betaine ABC transporter permease [Aquabacterium sp.]